MNQSARVHASLTQVIFLNGLLILVVSTATLVPMSVDLAAGNPDWRNFAAAGLILMFLGGLSVLGFRPGQLRLNLAHTYLLTTSAWISVSFAGALPFYLSFRSIDMADAVFEAVSGLTTTGATVLTGLDNDPPGILLWRAMLQWIGGIGIIVMGIFILPVLRVGGMQLFKTESSEKSDKEQPRMAQVVGSTALVYLLLTMACVVFLNVEGMTLFEAVVHAMTALSTGGFSTSDASVGHFQSPVIEWTLVVFMLAGSLPFLFYIRLAGRGRRLALRDSQVRSYLLFLFVVICALTLWRTLDAGVPLADAVRQAAFSVVTLVTTTGFVSDDYSTWGNPMIAVAFLLTLVGGCTGSTAGGIKIMRFQVLIRMLRRDVHKSFMPHAVVPLTYHGRPLSLEVTSGVLVFVLSFLLTILVLTVAVAMTGLDFVTALSAAATCVANVGPGLGSIVGPVGNFQPLPDSAKWLLAFGMIVGRLEVFTVFVLFSRGFWREVGGM